MDNDYLDKLVERLRTRRSRFHRHASVGDMADPECQEAAHAIVTLRAELEQTQDWKTFFAVQSRKHQHVLHIDGVKEALSALDKDEPQPVAWRYRYSDPITGAPIWRSTGGTWNGQSPTESQPLYTHEALWRDER